MIQSDGYAIINRDPGHLKGTPLGSKSLGFRALGFRNNGFSQSLHYTGIRRTLCHMQDMADFTGSE